MNHSFEVDTLDDAGRKAIELLRKLLDAQVFDRHGTAVKAAAEQLVTQYDGAWARLINFTQRSSGIRTYGRLNVESRAIDPTCGSFRSRHSHRASL